jgi:Ser/Thr protein kinase RdoA (MazF antagonist)
MDGLPPEWIWADSVLEQRARRLPELHDASIGFALDGAIWQSNTKVPAEVICHNDFSPHNLTFTGGAFVGAIDFDMCSPGPRLWDIAYLATRIVPLTGSTPDNAPGTHVARRRRGTHPARVRVGCDVERRVAHSDRSAY